MANPLRRRHGYRIRIPILSCCLPDLSVPGYLSPSHIFQLFASSALYLLGPILIFVTCGLLFSLSWTYWAVIVPLKFQSYTSFYSLANQVFVVFILVNVIFNYISCVFTRNFGTPEYESTIRELARATNFSYPESQEEIEEWRHDWREMLLERSRQKRLGLRYQMMSKYGLDEEKTSLTATPSSPSGDDKVDLNQDTNRTPVGRSNTLTNRKASHHGNLTNRKAGMEQKVAPMGRSWMWLGPYEWSYCEKTKLPKPPRSHYDHVTKSLVLNMDHYCPWMFNVVGYFNYRYFITFLLYTAVGMIYGAIITLQPFMMIDSREYHQQIIRSKDIYMNMHENNHANVEHKFYRYNHVQHLEPNVPIPNESAPIAFSFMMCFAVGLSVTILLGFHVYLIVTAQTTIEFHGNRLKKAHCKMKGEVWCNPYDMGTKRNLEQIFGSWERMRFLGVLLPSRRENQFLPIPFMAEVGLRSRWQGNLDDDVEKEYTDSIV